MRSHTLPDNPVVCRGKFSGFYKLFKLFLKIRDIFSVIIIVNVVLKFSFL